MRINQLTFTRFIAAILIVIFHFGKKTNIFHNDYTSFIFTQANVGVSYFFVLSGFVMIIAYGEQSNINFWNYIKNRFARIYPVYLLAIILLTAIKSFNDINKFDLILNLLMLQSWVPGKALSINYTGWSLSVELFFYIMFPILLNSLYSKKSLKKITIWIILFFVISQILYHLIINGVLELTYYKIRDIYYFPLMHFNEFLIGNLTGLFFIKRLKNNQRNYKFLILFTIFILILLLRFPTIFNYHNGFLSIIYAPMIILISLSNDKFTKFISRKFFIFLGEISFGIYILQVPIWVILSDYRMDKYLGLNKEHDFTTSFLIRTLILILVSALSYLFFEKPIRNKIKLHLNNRGKK